MTVHLCTYMYTYAVAFQLQERFCIHTRSCCSVSRRAASQSSRKCAVGRGVYGCSRAITASQSAANCAAPCVGRAQRV